MAKIFKEKILSVSSKKIREIETVVQQSGSWIKKMIIPNNLWTVSLLLILLAFIITLASQAELPPKVPLFYSRTWGDEQLAEKIFLFLFPVFSLFFLLINYLLSKFFNKKRDDFIPSLCSFFSFLFSLMAFFSLIKIILLVI